MLSVSSADSLPKLQVEIVERLGAAMSGVQVRRLSGADEFGSWRIKVRSKRGRVQLASIDGDCPFSIESDFNDDRPQANSVDEVVSIVKALFA